MSKECGCVCAHTHIHILKEVAISLLCSLCVYVSVHIIRSILLAFRIKAESEAENTDTSGISEHFQGLTITGTQPTLHLVTDG